MRELDTILDTPGRKVAVIVAHPDDETLWCGGLILMHPNHSWTIISLCRKSDPDRAPKFQKVLKVLKAEGAMGDMDDGAEQIPLKEEVVEKTILELLPFQNYDLVITHDPEGEYTRHRRHEETGSAVIRLWKKNAIKAEELWSFAYEDGGKSYYPKAIESASIIQRLPEEIWERKLKLITEVYGFEPGGFEVETTPKTEAFQRFIRPKEAMQWLKSTRSRYPETKFKKK